MNTKKFGLIVLLLTGALPIIGCETGEMSPSTSNYLDGAPCGSQIILDHSRLRTNCYLGSTCADCTASARSFLAKYPNINCTAEKSSDASIDYTTVVISPSFIEHEIQGTGCSFKL